MRGPGLALLCRQKAPGSSMAGTVLPLCLLLAAAMQGGLTQAPRPAARPGPLLLRLRRLEEQLHRLQEVTLSHLQSIAGNYNISYNIDGRFQVLAEQVEAAAAAQAALGAELARLASAGRRLHRRLKRLERTPHGLPDAAQSWEQEPQGWVAPSTASPQHLKARWWQQLRQEKHHPLPADAGPGGAPEEDADPPGDAALEPQAMAPALLTMTMVTQEQPPAPQQPAEGRYSPPAPAPTPPPCHTGSVLLFPNTSAENVAILGPGLHGGLQALSLCAWLATPAPHLGALLSYVTEDGSSKLAMRDHSGDLPGSARFVIGDGFFRELPVMPLLDGKWHHLCLTWSSSQGRYRFYVDRRLLAAGSGWEKDHPGKGSSTAEAFVGHLAGLALWSRALLPGEVASMATGQGLPRRPLLTLADASLQGGVRRVAGMKGVLLVARKKYRSLVQQGQLVET
ncbi:pentraxin 4, long [Columba livia]|uniref:Pentraxin 4, long n=1 Tax=Columba livia TaxID=8932 RepID=A0A2I0M4A0_COLLI|nr:pentraxin 4, long [Columba livia]